MHDPQLAYRDGKLGDRPNGDHFITRSPVVLPPGCKLGRHPEVGADEAGEASPSGPSGRHRWQATPGMHPGYVLLSNGQCCDDPGAERGKRPGRHPHCSPVR
ncbi:MAG TPA: hypothetical protein VIV12_11625 [Streptosporangiaceae bacterium]